MKFKTASGSTYEIWSPHYENTGTYIRRVNEEHSKRADGDWVPLVNEPTIVVGEQAVLVMESLRPYGGDDYGTPDEAADSVTTRVTSTVTEVYDA